MIPRTHYFERVSSTMDVLHELAASGAPAGSAVVAGEQLQGRGSRGRSWHSPPGGAWLSVLFRPEIIEGLEVMSLRAGLAVAETIQPLVPALLQLKWPNDLMLSSRKVGGVLCEARWQGDNLGWIVVGVGLNVQNDIPEELQSSAVALAALVPAITVKSVAGPILAAIRKLDRMAGRLSPAEMSRFAGRDWLRGRPIREPLVGTVRGLSEDGALRVHTTEGSDISLHSGPVELADALPAR